MSDRTHFNPDSITQGDTNPLSDFNLSVDPDEIFRPMLTSYSTRPDRNCGDGGDE